MIDGVGGAFIFSSDPERLAKWYQEHLDLSFERAGEGAFYQMFWGLDPEDPSRKMDTTFAIMQASVPIPKHEGGPEPESMYGDQPFMVNLRVRDLGAVLDHLAGRGVKPIQRQDEEYGCFAWVRDADG
ncbi:MAG: hypothetical protein AMS21_06620, partial [Gemmatimonas sp. SG8_38_2]